MRVEAQWGGCVEEQWGQGHLPPVGLTSTLAPRSGRAAVAQGDFLPQGGAGAAGAGSGTWVMGRLEKALPQSRWHRAQSLRAGRTVENHPSMLSLPRHRCPSGALSQTSEAKEPEFASLLYSPERGRDLLRPSRASQVSQGLVHRRPTASALVQA